MSRKKSTISKSTPQDFSLSRPLQTVIHALSPLTFQPLFSPESSLLDLLINLAPSVSNTVVLTTASLAASVSRRCQVFTVSSPDLSPAAALRELYGTGLNCPVSGEFLLLDGRCLYRNFLDEVGAVLNQTRHHEKVLTRFFASAAPTTAIQVHATSREVLAICKVSAKDLAEATAITVNPNRYVDVYSFDIFRLLADQLDWELHDLVENLCFSKHCDGVSGEYAAASVLSNEQALVNLDDAEAKDIVECVQKSLKDFFPILPSRQVARDTLVGKAVELADSADLSDSVVTGSVSVAAKIEGCVVSGENLVLKGTFKNCVIYGRDRVVSGVYEDVVLIEGLNSNEAKAPAVEAPEASDSEAPGDFQSEVNAYIAEANEQDSQSMEAVAKQLRIFRTTQQREIAEFVKAVAVGVANKAAQVAAGTNAKKQDAVMVVFEAWSELLDEMYIEDAYLDEMDLEEVLATAGKGEEWLVLWGMYVSGFLVDKAVVLGWWQTVASEAARRDVGMKKFIEFVKDEDSEEDE